MRASRIDCVLTVRVAKFGCCDKIGTVHDKSQLESGICESRMWYM
jgi:hypothetical protein